MLNIPVLAVFRKVVSRRSQHMVCFCHPRFGSNKHSGIVQDCGHGAMRPISHTTTYDGGEHCQFTFSAHVAIPAYCTVVPQRKTRVVTVFLAATNDAGSVDFRLFQTLTAKRAAIKLLPQQVILLVL